MTRKNISGSALLVVMVIAAGSLMLPEDLCAFELNLHQTTTGGVNGTPFWLQANRWGLYSDSPLQGSLGMEASLDRDFGQHWNVELLADIDGFMDDDGGDVRLRFGYGALSWRVFEVKGGMYPDIMGILPSPELSSGSMSVSGNARPLPKVQFAIPDWTTVPFTNDVLEIRGGLAHGWFLGERAVDNVLLHEKWGYGRFGPQDGTKVYLGLVHQTMWGGSVQQANWDNYTRAFFGRDASEDSSELGPAGNSVGMWDIGIEMPLERVDLHGYYHHYFELEHGIYFKNALDGLWGLGIDIPDTTYWPDTVVLESLYTVYQGGRYHRLSQVLDDAGITQEPDQTFGIGGGAHQYYSHGIYLNGWTHLDRIIGNPLIVATGSGDDLRIAGNRVNAYHVGLSGVVVANIRYTGKLTFATYKPTRIGARTYAPVSLVPEGETWVQTSFFVGLEIDNAFGREPLGLSLGFGADWGDVYDNTAGFELAVRYELIGGPRNPE